MSKFFLPALLVVTLILSVYAQDQSGFISLDCGLPEHSSYTESTTRINYISDENFIDTGVRGKIAPIFKDKIKEEFVNLRSFPEGLRNCYNVKLPRGRGTRHLIKASFKYGNYDNKNSFPKFDLYVGVNKWDTVTVEDNSGFLKELIHVPTTDNVSVCLVNTGFGTPFISALEFRPLNNATYEAELRFLNLKWRFNLGSVDNYTIRYDDDIYDRDWWPFNYDRWKRLSTTYTVKSSENTFEPPSIVMQTASTQMFPSSPLMIPFEATDSNTEFYVYMHFAEIELLQPNETREFNIYQNGEFWYGPVELAYLDSRTIYTSKALIGQKFEISLERTNRSTHPPIFNAFEIYTAVELSQLPTDQGDVEAIMNIKSVYELSGVKKDWQGDPCAPTEFTWHGLNCSFISNEPPRITSLNLSSSGLSGNISSYIADLASLQTLDLSNNSLSGQIPDFLSDLRLTELNLKGNNLTGPVPPGLIDRSNDESLHLSVDDYLLPCSSNSCEQPKKSFLIPIVASIAAFVVLLIVVVIIVWIFRRNRVPAKFVIAPPVENVTTAPNIGMTSVVTASSISTPSPITSFTEPNKSREFTYSEVLRITNNFERSLGQGGFGMVFHGHLNNIQVAVKMLSASAHRGCEQFIAEVKLLMRVHHKNLTALVGYCKEDNHLGLIYEYMANGNLEMHLSGGSVYALNWGTRLGIALDAAQGLEYLHNGCKPPIIHRDVKSNNILLNESFQAKLGDFGLSRIIPNEGGTHVSTVVAGTPGYLDPEYYALNRLTEKSDVYSFGVVLLELITGRPAITRGQDNFHISRWVDSLLKNGDLRAIVDVKLRGDFDNNSVWKLLELAMTCLSQTSLERPTMGQVINELKECFELENHRAKAAQGNYSKDSIESVSMILDSRLSPLPR